YLYEGLGPRRAGARAGRALAEQVALAQRVRLHLRHSGRDGEPVVGAPLAMVGARVARRRVVEPARDDVVGERVLHRRESELVVRPSHDVDAVSVEAPRLPDGEPEPPAVCAPSGEVGLEADEPTELPREVGTAARVVR